MMDAMGIYQHHDAVTGTAKDPVAKNYWDRLNKSMATNDASYAEILESLSGFSTDGGMQTCSYYYGSYKDCPMANVVTGDTWNVVAHNPAAVSQDYLRFKLPMQDYEVTSSAGDSLEYDLLCYDYWENDGARDQKYTDCDMFVPMTVEPTSVNTLSIKNVGGNQQKFHP